MNKWIIYVCGLVYHSNGIKPQFIELNKILFMGVEQRISAVDVEKKSIIFNLDLPSGFYEFVYLDQFNLFVICCELDVVVIRPDGEKRWAMGLNDIVDKFKIKGNKSIYITCIDEI